MSAPAHNRRGRRISRQINTACRTEPSADPAVRRFAREHAAACAAVFRHAQGQATAEQTIAAQMVFRRGYPVPAVAGLRS